jgi:hypothetical protein
LDFVRKQNYDTTPRLFSRTNSATLSMITIEITAEEIDTLAYERYHYPDPKIQKKLDVLYLKSMGLKHQEICKICRICETTLTTYLRQYQAGGIEQLKETR